MSISQVRSHQCPNAKIARFSDGTREAQSQSVIDARHKMVPAQMVIVLVRIDIGASVPGLVRGCLLSLMAS